MKFQQKQENEKVKIKKTLRYQRCFHCIFQSETKNDIVGAVKINF
jgi:hypothetical protein